MKGPAAPGIRLHDRTRTVVRAENTLHGYLLALMEEYDLSYTETAAILTSLAGNAIKYALRDERHPGNPGKKADEK